jgi:hypothetical protein
MSRLLTALLTGVLLLPASPALASLQSEEREGAQVVSAVDRGQRSCSGLSDADFERVGEFVMGRMLGNEQVHEAMNARMASAMGRAREEQMHVFLGERFTGCRRGKLTAGLAGMMGFRGSGTTGGAGHGDYGPGMMSGSRSGSSSGSEISAAAAVLIAVFAALAGGGLVALYLGRRSTPRSS